MAYNLSNDVEHARSLLKQVKKVLHRESSETSISWTCNSRSSKHVHMNSQLRHLVEILMLPPTILTVYAVPMNACRMSTSSNRVGGMTGPKWNLSKRDGSGRNEERALGSVGQWLLGLQVGSLMLLIGPPFTTRNHAWKPC